ncbi:MAG: MATE family efflux transporter, partial [Caulobacteraceae bacterium]
MTELIEKSLLPPRSSAAGRPAPWLAEASALLALAAPLIVTQLGQMAIMTTDVLMLGRFSKTALASAAIGGTVFYAAWLIGGGPPAAVAPMIAQALGARSSDRAGVRTAVRMGLWAIALISPFLVAFLWFAHPLLLALRQDPVLAAGAGRFVSMLSYGLPFSLGFFVLRNFAAAVERPRATLFVTAAAIAWNAIADWAL